MSDPALYVVIGIVIFWFISYLAESRFIAFCVICLAIYMGWFDDTVKEVKRVMRYPDEISDRLHSTGHFLENTRK